LKLSIFILNPTTWTDIRRFDRSMFPNGFIRFSFHPIILFASAFAAMSFKLGIAYFVCVDSISLILEARTGKDAIFNSLAIIFISELDKVAWQVGTSLFSVQLKKDWVFTVDRNADDNIAQIGWLKTLTAKAPYMRRGHGARNSEFFVVLIVMFLIYTHMLLVVLNAFQTNVLPAARDVCLMHRLMHGDDQYHWLEWCVMGTLRIMMVRDLEEKIDRLSLDTLDDQCRENELYGRMSSSQQLSLIKDRPVEFAIFTTMFVILLILPQAMMPVMEHFFTPADKKPSSEYSPLIFTRSLEHVRFERMSTLETRLEKLEMEKLVPI